MYPDLKKFLSRDYFSQPDSSLSCSFVLQGLFRPAGFISILLFFSTEIISASQIHLYLALFLSRDYFGRPDSSLSCSFSPQGLFRPAGFISILLFSPQGLLCPGQMHLYLALFLLRDYFGRPDSSLSCSFSPQGLFQPPGFIPIWLFCSAGIISPRSDTSPLAENISTRPFRQLPTCLIINEAMICSFLIILRIKAFLYKQASIHSQNYVQKPVLSKPCSIIQRIEDNRTCLSGFLQINDSLICGAPETQCDLLLCFNERSIYKYINKIQIFICYTFHVLSASRNKISVIDITGIGPSVHPPYCY